MDNPQQMVDLWKMLYSIRRSEEAHPGTPWGAKKLQMRFLWKIFRSISKFEETHQDSS